MFNFFGSMWNHGSTKRRAGRRLGGSSGKDEEKIIQILEIQQKPPTKVRAC